MCWIHLRYRSCSLPELTDAGNYNTPIVRKRRKQTEEETWEAESLTDLKDGSSRPGTFTI